MLSRAQQIMFKRAQAEAGLGDEEYRAALTMIAGVRSSTDPRLTDRQFDAVMGYFEAICWKERDAGRRPAPGPKAVFRLPGYWASKNPAGNTSRDRYASNHAQHDVRALEDELERLGFGAGYRRRIRDAVMGDSTISPTPVQLQRYRAALERTLNSKRRQPAAQAANCPF
jgi:hypothetical protein